MDWMGDIGLGGCTDPSPGCVPYCQADCFLLTSANGSLPNFGISTPEKRDFFCTRPAEAKTLGEGLISANGKAWGVFRAASATCKLDLGFSVGSVVPLRIGGRPLPRRLFNVGITGVFVRGIRRNMEPTVAIRRGIVGRIGASRLDATSGTFSLGGPCAKVLTERLLDNSDREGDKSASSLESLAMDTDSLLFSL